MAAPLRRISRNNGAERLGERLAICQSCQRIVASRGHLACTSNAAQLLVCFTESACNVVEKDQSRRSTSDSAENATTPMMKRHRWETRLEFIGPTQGPEHLSFQTAFPGREDKAKIWSAKPARRTAPTRARVNGTGFQSIHPAGMVTCHCDDPDERPVPPDPPSV